MVEIRLLGQTGLWMAGREVPLARSHRRCILAILSMTPGQPVSTESLIDRVWDDRPPPKVTHSLYTHVSAVRRALQDAGNKAESGSVRRVDGGYVLEIDPDRVDLLRARRYATEARAIIGDRTGGGEAVIDLLRQASSLWHGVPLGGLNGSWVIRVRQGLDQERLALLVDRFRLELQLGEHASAVGPIAALLADYPLVEPLAGLHMLALYRCGRQAEALAAYANVRQWLVDEIGDDPGAELRRLHDQILRRDSVLDVVPTTASTMIEPTPVAPGSVPPAHLPAAAAGFVGRADALRTLDELLPEPQHTSPVSLISAIDGMAGVGKPKPGI